MLRRRVDDRHLHDTGLTVGQCPGVDGRDGEIGVERVEIGSPGDPATGAGDFEQMRRADLGGQPGERVGGWAHRNRRR